VKRDADAERGDVVAMVVVPSKNEGDAGVVGEAELGGGSNSSSTIRSSSSMVSSKGDV